MVIKKRIHENLIDMIMNYTGFFKIPKEKIKNMYGLCTLLINRIYYMYNNEIADWMYYYNHNHYQVLIWKQNKFNIDKLNNLYIIILELLKDFFNFDISIIKNKY